jgi:hypothetical protein
VAKRRVNLTVAPLRKLCLILTSKGLDFVDRWFKSNEHIPSNLTKLYQLLLQTARLNGVVNVWMAIRLGYSKDAIDKAISKAYLKLSSRPRKPNDEVLRRIKEIHGKAPKEIYA